MNAYQWESGGPGGWSAAAFAAPGDREAHARAARETGGEPYQLYRRVDGRFFKAVPDPDDDACAGDCDGCGDRCAPAWGAR